MPYAGSLIYYWYCVRLWRLNYKDKAQRYTVGDLFVERSTALLGSIKSSQRRSGAVRCIGSYCGWIPVQRPTLILSRYQLIKIDEGFKELRNIVMKLETETNELRAEVVKLLLAQESRLNIGQCRQQTKQIEDVVVSSQATVSASPFRPPPAPPLPPPSPNKSTRCLVVKVKPKTERERDNSFLEELSKRPPKLRHVELSPGGRPVRVRKSSSSNDPSGLSYVLKKRYIALHNSPRLSLDRCKRSPSFS